MGGRYVEIRRAPGTKLSQHIATHLHVRYPFGKVIVVTDYPELLISLVRKQWLRGLQLLQRERAATLDQKLIKEINAKIEAIATVRFDIAARLHGKWVDVTFVDISKIGKIPAECKTIYWCTRTKPFADFLDQLPKDCVLIIYYETHGSVR